MWLKVKENKLVNDTELLTVGTLFTCHILKIFCLAGWGKHSVETGWVMTGCIGWLKAGEKRVACDRTVCHLDPGERAYFKHTCDPCFHRGALIILAWELVHLAPGQTNTTVLLSLQIITLFPFCSHQQMLLLSQDSLRAHLFFKSFVPSNTFISLLCHLSTFKDPLRGFCILVILLPLPNDQK